MQLIDDIEAQVAINGESFRGPLLREAWPRIKAALESVDKAIKESKHKGDMPGCPICDAVSRFRAATEGAK